MSDRIVVRKDGKSIFSMAKEISYYSGYDGGESWSEGSRNAHAYFKVPEAGNYTLGIEGQTDRRTRPGTGPRSGSTGTAR